MNQHLDPESDGELMAGLEALAVRGLVAGPSAAVLERVRAGVFRSGLSDSLTAGVEGHDRIVAPTAIPLTPHGRSRPVRRRRRTVSLTVALAACVSVIAAVGLEATRPAATTLRPASGGTEKITPAPGIPSDAELATAHWSHTRVSRTTGGCTQIFDQWDEINGREYTTFPQKVCVSQPLLGLRGDGLAYETLAGAGPDTRRLTLRQESTRSPAAIDMDIAWAQAFMPFAATPPDDAKNERRAAGIAGMDFYPLTANTRAESFRQMKAIPGMTTSSGVDALGRRVIWVSRVSTVQVVFGSATLDDSIRPTRIWWGYDPASDMLISSTDGVADAAGNPALGPDGYYLLAWDTTGLSRARQDTALDYFADQPTPDPVGCTHPIVPDNQPDNVAEACPSNAPESTGVPTSAPPVS